MTTYLVTGGTGFLGQHLVRGLLDAGHAVRVLARSSDRALERAGATFVRGSVLNPRQLEEAVAGVDGVFHLAGKVERDPKRAHRLFTLHVTGTRNVLEAVAATENKPRIVYASTSGTVGVTTDGRTIPDDESELATEVVKDWPYYLSKVYAEKAVDSFAKRKGLDVVTMRPTLLLGPGDSRLSSTGDVQKFLDRKIPVVPSGGVSFVDVRDVAVAFIAAMERGHAGARYLLGGANLTFEAFFERLETISGIAGPRVSVPDRAALTGARFLDAVSRFVGREPDVDPISVEMAQHFWYIDWSAAMRDLGFAPRDPGQTLYDTVSWLRTNRPQHHEDEVDSAHPFAPDQAWEDNDLRHAAFAAPQIEAGTESIPHVGQSKLSYDTYGDGAGLDSLVGGALKGAMGSLFGGKDAERRDAQPQVSTPKPTPPTGRGELDELLASASPEELETVLRLVRRMKT